MTEHENWLELLSASLDGELSDADHAALEEHLAACPECRRVKEAFTAIGDCFPAEAEPPANFTEGTMYLIRQEAARPQGWRRFFGQYGRWTGVAAAAVVLLLGFSAIRGGLLKAPLNKDAASAGVNMSVATAEKAEAPQSVENAVLTTGAAEEDAVEADEAAGETLGASLFAVPSEGGAETAAVSAMAGGASGAVNGDRGEDRDAGFAMMNDAAEEESASFSAEADECEAEEYAFASEEPAPAPEPEMPAEDMPVEIEEASASEPEPEAAPESASEPTSGTAASGGSIRSETNDGAALAQGFSDGALSPAALMERYGGQGWYAVGVLDVLPAELTGLQAEPELGAGCYSLPRAEMDAFIKAAAFVSMFFDEDGAERGLVIVLSEGE